MERITKVILLWLSIMIPAAFVAIVAIRHIIIGVFAICVEGEQDG